jgi:hypothetical protein
MRQIERPPTVYVIYPAALLDGWEVVTEHREEPLSFDTREEASAYAKAQAALNGGALIKFENWYGEAESALEVQPQRPHSHRHS